MFIRSTCGREGEREGKNSVSRQKYPPWHPPTLESNQPVRRGFHLSAQTVTALNGRDSSAGNFLLVVQLNHCVFITDTSPDGALW